MKYLVILSAAVILSGCGWFDRKMASFTGYSKVCIEGVTYLQFSSGSTPQYSIDGKLVACQ